MKLTTIAWRNIGRNRRRSALSITAVAVATLSIVVLFSVLEGMKSDLIHNLTTFYTGEVRLRHREYGRYEHLNPLHLSVDDADRLAGELRSLEGVAGAVPRLTVSGAVFRDDERTGLQAVGVNFAAEESFSDIGAYIVAGTLAEVTGAGTGTTNGGEAPAPTPAPAASSSSDRGSSGGSSGARITPVVVGNGVLDRLEIGLNDTFTVVVRTARRGTNAMTFRAVAVADFPVDSLNERAFWAPIASIQRLTGMPGQAGEILVKLDDTVSQETVMAAIRDVAGGVEVSGEGAGGSGGDAPLEVQHFSEIETTYSFIEMASTAYTILGLFFFLLAGTVIVNTTMMVIFERRQEIGTLEAMGMQARELIRMFFTEALLLGAIGAAAGLVLGIALTVVLGQVGLDFSAAMEGVDFEISPVLYPVLNVRSTVVVFLFSVAVSGAVSFIPTRRITRIEPVAALRE
jgi:putative ABC transport system permease protein